MYDFSKVEKVAKIDQNSKGLTLTFCSFLAIFQLFKNGSKTKANPLKIILRHFSSVFLGPFCTIFQKLKKWPKSTKMVRG